MCDDDHLERVGFRLRRDALYVALFLIQVDVQHDARPEEHAKPRDAPHRQNRDYGDVETLNLLIGRHGFVIDRSNLSKTNQILIKINHSESVMQIYTLLEKLYGKRARRSAQRMARAYQRMMFDIYIRKYIKKHIKLRVKDPQERPELVEYVNKHSKECDIVIALLKEHQERIVASLREVYCDNPKASMTFYHYTYAPVRAMLREHAMDRVYEIVPMRECCVAEVIDDVVTMADDLRYGFMVSDNVAKSKIREHWIERPPPVICFLCLVMTIRFFSFFFDNTFDTEDHLYILLTLMSMGSIYLVYLRVPQSICAEAKKNAQEKYFNYKTQLHLMLLKSISKDALDSYMNDECKNYVRTNTTEDLL